MKKIYYLIATAIMALTFTSCEDVPAPFGQPVDPNTGAAEQGGEGGGSSVDAKVVTIAAFNAAAEDDTWYELTGAIKNMKDDDVYGNFDLEDATGSVYVYGLLETLGGEKKKFQDIVKKYGLSNGTTITIHANRGSYNSKIEAVNAYFVKVGGGSGGGSDTPSGEAKGTGTQTDPFNIAAAIAKCKEVGTTASTDKYYIKGIVVKGGTASGGYGNVSFDMGDTKESTDLFKAYQVAGTDGEKLADGYEVKVGDEVVIYGPVVTYGSTYETSGKSAAQIVTINGKKTSETGGDTGEAKGTGTQTDPFNIAAAIAKCKEVGTTASTDKYYIKGIVVKGGTASGGYGNVSFDMGDTKESTDLFKAYQVAGTDGEKLADGYEVKVGDEVVIYGPVVTYGSTYETSGKSAAQIVTINGKKTSETGGDTGGGDTSGSGGGTVSGNTLTINAADFGFATGVPATSATLVDGTVVAFDKGSNSNNSPQYYDGTYAAVRVYLNNEFTITASKNISKIEILTNDPASSGDKYNGSDTAVAEAGSNTINVVKESDTKISFSGLNAKTVKVKNSTTATSKNQLRIKTMIITYAN